MNEFESNFKLISSSKIGIFCTIKNVKVDFIHYNFKLLHLPEIHENIRVLNKKDIAAMKIQAILGRGAKKDFFDLYELLKKYSLNEIIEFHKQKYPLQTLQITIPQALIYFEDAEASVDPVSLNNTTWEMVKKSLQQIVNEFLK